MVVENNERKPKEKEWPQILVILLSSVAGINCGIGFVWPSPSVPILTSKDHPLHVTLEQASYFTVLPPLATTVSALVFANVLDRVGRKNCLLFLGIPQVISLLLIAFANSVWMLYAARFLIGISDACLFTTLPTYIAEVSTPKVRGTWGNALALSLFFGALIMNIIGAYVDISTTAMILSIIPIVYFFAVLFMPESPYFLIMKGRNEEAKTSLKWLRQNDQVDEEFVDVSNAVKRQMAESSTYKDLFCVLTNRKAISAGTILRFTQQFSGIASFSVYSQYIFQLAGGDLSASASAITCASVLTFGSFISCFVLDKLGRRIAMLSSGIGCVTVLISMAVFFFLKDCTNTNLSSVLWFPIVGMLSFIIIFSQGLGMVPTLMMGELFSSNIKGKALAFLNIMFGIYVAASTKIFQILLSNFGLYAPFSFYAICCTVGLVVCYYTIPETKGKTLENIQLDMQKNKTKIKHFNVENHI